MPHTVHLSDPGDLVGRKKADGRFLAAIYRAEGSPEWMLAGTSLVAQKEIPDIISVRDRLKLIGNLARHSANPGYFIEHLEAGTPRYPGALDLAMKSAPTFKAGLELVTKYAKYHPGYLHHTLTANPREITVELHELTYLGDAQAPVVDCELLVYLRMAGHFAGRRVKEARIEVRHGEPRYLSAMAAAFPCERKFDGDRDAITFSASVGAMQNIAFDNSLWRIAVQKCADEEVVVHDTFLAEIIKRVTDCIETQQRVLRMDELADILGKSSRTLIRRLRDENCTYQELVDSILQRRSLYLLQDLQRPISRVAAELGMPDTPQFYRRFKRWFGVTPGEFRKSLSK